MVKVCCLFSSFVRQVSFVSAKKKQLLRDNGFFCECEGKPVVMRLCFL